MRRTPPRRRHAFTLIELLVVIGIIVLLAAILIPTIAHIRTSVHQSATAARVQAIMSGIEQYFHQFNAYPGPVPDAQVSWGAKFPNPNQGQTATDAASGNAPTPVTSTENLTLGLSGGLYVGQNTKDTNGNQAPAFDPTKVDKGALSLNPFKAATRYGPFVEAKAAGLESQAAGGVWKKWGDTMNHPGEALPNQAMYDDDAIPEYVDAYPDAMPILYMRAAQGVSGSIEGAPGVAAGSAAYNPSQLQPYVFPALDNSMGSPVLVQIINNAFSPPGPSGGPDSQVLADFWQPGATPAVTPANYFGQYTAPAKPRNNSYLLITAGPDRKYMTHDDTINNGSAVK